MASPGKYQYTTEMMILKEPKLPEKAEKAEEKSNTEKAHDKWESVGSKLVHKKCENYHDNILATRAEILKISRELEELRGLLLEFFKDFQILALNEPEKISKFEEYIF